MFNFNKKNSFLVISIFTAFVFVYKVKGINNISNQNPKKTSSLIDNLGHNDTLIINRDINGCEMHSSEKIKIYKQSDTLFARLSINLDDGIIHTQLTHSLSKISISAYNKFEMEIKKHSSISGGCTSISNYSIHLNSVKFMVEDRGCKFEGYDILKEKIFGQVAIENYNKSIYR